MKVSGKQLTVWGLGAAAMLLAVWIANQKSDSTPEPALTPAPVVTAHQQELPMAHFVGASACSTCHKSETDAYRGSHHDHAIEEPTREAILAPFAGEAFTHDGVKTTFLQKAEEFYVRTLNAAGKPEDFRVVYTFGYFPLQQYLLDLGNGRLQAFVVAWDSRPQSEGGQRYYDLYPNDDLTPRSELHWTRPGQNWNFACADCHTTALQKGYDEKTNHFKPTWAELDVSCEACHGPASNHVAWAQKAPPTGTPLKHAGFTHSLRPSEPWTISSGAPSATPHSQDGQHTELETCAPCHSRRMQLKERTKPGDAYLDTYLLEFLREGLYYPDGQIHDEVYVYGSFLQSKMHQAGVRCSDCHDPHSLKLRRPGNLLCAGCHSPTVFETKAHHFHGEQGSACVDCHMPETTYMGVDERRDHSIRIPRPDLSVSIGTPNACNRCHSEQSAAWAAAQVTGWYGPERRPHFGTVFAAARRGDPKAASPLIALAADPNTPLIVRGSALMLLANYPHQALGPLQNAVQSSEPLLRLGVTQGVRGLPPEQRARLLLPLLNDPLLSIRTEATRNLVGIRQAQIPPAHRDQVDRALQELRQTEQFNADRPDTHLRLALLAAGDGDLAAAERSLERALELDPLFTPAMINLADLTRRSAGDEQKAEELIRRALSVEEDNAEAWHALGLSLIRQRKLKEALPLLRKAAILRPENPRFHYVCAVALRESGDLAGAVKTLQVGLQHHAHDRQLLQTLITFAKDAGDRELAAQAAIQMAGLND